MKNILIISGGSGNDALLNGIFHYYKKANIKVLVNAYDDGKSTGICRALTNTLGVSDIRKNHYRMYQLVSGGSENNGIVSFYKDRYDLPKGNELNFVLTKLSLWGLSQFSKYATHFFDGVSNVTFNDFSIANIIYSQMYKELGYNVTNSIMCDLLGIDDFVIMNSFENVVIGAKTKNGEIEDEAGIVDFSNNDDKIEKVVYKSESPIILNHDAISAINYADIIIISTGTFWSSIFPTLEYGQLYKVINKSKARKFWMMNNEQDKDSIGVGSNEFIEKVANLGLNLNDFTIIENLDAHQSLRQVNIDYNVQYYSMGNNKGKHNPNKMARAIFCEYYNINNAGYDSILLDFDHTIYDGDESFDVVAEILVEVSKNNKASIISGNDYKSHIRPILQKIFGKHLYAFQNDVWADASSIKYVMGEKKKCILKNLIRKDDLTKIASYLCSELNIKGIANDDVDTTCYKIKPLNKLERDLLYKLLNELVFSKLKINNIKAVKAGKTTIDIVSSTNNKKVVFEEEGYSNSLYIGDELMDYGNDYEIAKCCNHSIAVESIHETLLILKLLSK